MPDIHHQLMIRSTLSEAFQAASTPAGLRVWWSRDAKGEPWAGATYQLDFGPAVQWRAVVTRYIPDAEFELRLTEADPDWVGSRVGVRLTPAGGVIRLDFHHEGWPEPNEHYRISCFCWAMYLRVLKRHLEHGETVPYEKRLDV